MSQPETAGPDTEWTGLYKAGGASFVITGILFFVAVALFATSTSPPTDAEKFLKVFATSNLNLATTSLFVVVTVLFIPAILGLFAALKGGSRTYALMGAGLTLLGIGIFFISNITSVALAQLGQSYASAADASQRASFVAAANATLALSNAAGLFGGLFAGLGTVAFGLAMLKGVFKKGQAYLGIAAGILSLLGSVPALFVLSFVFFPLSGIWFIWIGSTLYRLG